MLVDFSVLEQINGRIRRRVLELPVTSSKARSTLVHPKTGRRLKTPGPASLTVPVQQKCPMREGGEYLLRERAPYARHLVRAANEPTRARAVLYLLDHWQETPKPVQITVTDVQRVGDIWIIRFRKGSHPELSGEDIFLSRQNDFTMDASRQTVKGDPAYCPPFAEDLERARRKAKERRVSPQRQRVSKMRSEAGELRAELTAMKDRQRLRRIEHDLAKLARGLPSPDAVESMSTLASDGPHMDVARRERPPVSDSSRDTRDVDAEVSLATSEAAA